MKMNKEEKINAAFAEYEKGLETAGAEYLKARKTAWAEYLKVVEGGEEGPEPGDCEKCGGNRVAAYPPDGVRVCSECGCVQSDQGGT